MRTSWWIGVRGVSPDLLDLVQDMFSAAHSGDPDRLDRIYAPGFVCAEVEWDGRTSEIARCELLDTVARGEAASYSPASLAEVEVLDCSVEDDLAIVVYRWQGPGPAVVHTLAWDLTEDPPLLLRVLVAQPPD